MSELKKTGRGNPFAILFVTIGILILVSFLPLVEISDGNLKSYNLFGDLFPKGKSEPVVAAETYIDPDLLELESVKQTDEPAETETGEAAAADDGLSTSESSNDPIYDDGESDVVIQENIPAGKPSDYDAVGGEIEDYTPGKVGLDNFRKAISSGRLARVGVIGDSYIEGDIFTQNVRDKLQQRYGGKGVGYVPVSSNLTGFRQSVRQTCSGWTEHDFRNKGRKYATLQGFYYTPSVDGAKTTFQGSKKMANAGSWDVMRMLVVSPVETTVKVKSGDSEAISFDVVAAPDSVQEIRVDGLSGKVSISASAPELVVLGVYLDGETGIALDNMSIRGYSGIKHNLISFPIASQMRKFVDYDLIVVEYGINALSSAQKDYTPYIRAMEKAIKRIKECYPNADILVMGIGDRGEKVGTEIRSMSTVNAMISAQRDMARRLGLLFWDTRASMGGPNSVVSWANSRDINKDYIHLSFNGGERLADLFVNSLTDSLNE